MMFQIYLTQIHFNLDFSIEIVLIIQQLSKKMIWDLIQQSTFDEYFNQGNQLTVETLLLDQNIITQFKNLNPKLIQYIEANKQVFISKLIYYTVQLPQITDSQDRIRKFPYVSSQILAIDNRIIFQEFLNEKSQQNPTKINYFDRLMAIFKSQACDNQILLGYFLKIVQNLYKCQKKKTAKQIYKFRQTLFQNLNQQSVGTVLKSALILLDVQQGFIINQRIQIIHKIIDYLVDGQEKIKTVAKNILNQTILKFQTFSSGDQLLKTILQSPKLVQIFSIKESRAIDQFIIGYLQKSLEKICTSDNTYKQLIEITSKHKQFIHFYICQKKHLFQQKQIQSVFMNQSKQKVNKIDKNIVILLKIVKLSLQNGIIGFLQQPDINNLWNILHNHVLNDIVKVKIFEIFTLFYLKKDEKVQKIFEKTFFINIIKLFSQNKQMYGHFIFQFWKNVSKKSKFIRQGPTKLNQYWENIVEYIEQNEKYQIEIQKVIDRNSNRTKVVKLIVDEQDAAPNSNSIYVKQQQNIQKLATQSFDKQTVFDKQFQQQINQEIVQTKPIQIKQKIKIDPFAAFQMFSIGTKDSKLLQLIKETEQKKKADFSDFSSFF